jgi:hypothetical protein
MPSLQFHVPPEPTVQMRLLRAVALLILGMLLPRSVQADAVTFLTAIGADFQGGLPSPLSGGVVLGGVSDSSGHFLFGNPLAPVVELVAKEGVGTGPLVSHIDNSWTFTGGNVEAEPDGETASFIPFPPLGYSTCEAAGFITSKVGVGCILTPVLSGTLIGDTVLRLSDPVAVDGGFGGSFELAGPVTFGINMDLARAGGVSTGPYFGSLRVDGGYFQDPFGYRFTYDRFEVSGATAPEPSTLLLLAAAAGIALLVSRSHRVA